MEIHQAKILEWVAMPSSRASSQPRSSALQVVSLPSEPPGKPMSAGVVVCPFSRGSSQPRNRIGVSCIAGRFFTSWATGEATEPLSHGSFDTVILLPHWFILFNWFVGHYPLLVFLLLHLLSLLRRFFFFSYLLIWKCPRFLSLFLVLLSCFLFCLHSTTWWSYEVQLF